MTTADAIVNGGAVAIALGLLEVIKAMVRKIGGDKANSCMKSLLHQQERTADAVGKMADHVNELTTTVAVIDTKVSGIDAKLDRLAV